MVSNAMQTPAKETHIGWNAFFSGGLKRAITKPWEKPT
jgi:hypothetical protein